MATRYLIVSYRDWDDYWKVDLTDEQLETFKVITYILFNYDIQHIKVLDWNNENDWKYAPKDENGKIKPDRIVTYKDVIDDIKNGIKLKENELNDLKDLLKIAEEEESQ